VDPSRVGELVGKTAEPDEPSRRPPSLEDLFREQYGAAVRLAYLLTGSRAVAEDVVQDSFVRLHGHWNRVQQPTAYLRATVVNACRAYHRRARRERTHFPELVVDSVSPETPIVLDALAALPYRQRAALALRFYEDRPDREIAEALRCRPATVRSLIHRGLTALRQVTER
jgi:RNA polymerase sigma factor (sigma-70 family)